jgi:hypothetical protein
MVADRRFRLTALIAVALSSAIVATSDGVTRKLLRPGCQSTPSSAAVVYVSVTDSYGRCVPDLRSADFAVSVDNIPATITSFSPDDTPAAIGVLLDVSGSMRDKEPSTMLSSKA